MNIEIESVTQETLLDDASVAVQNDKTRARSFPVGLESCIVFILALAALLPRIVLANTLDIVTDEVVYITAAKKDFALLTSLQIGSPQWSYNYEHPPLVKFLIGFSLRGNSLLGTPLNPLFAARLPSILAGTLLVVALYWLGRAPFGRTVALTASLCLAVSPWLVYFGALAYLDMTMTMLIALASLLTWHALRRPWLYPVIALLMGLGAASKYTAVLAIPGIMLFTGYYFLLVRLTLPITQRPRIPWLWWLASLMLAPSVFLLIDLAIWPHPLDLLLHSFRYEWEHAYNGHLIFLAGRYVLHAPLWTAMYIVFAKMSIFVTLPAVFFLVYSLLQLLRFHQGEIGAGEAMPIAFLSSWLFSTLIMFSLLKITVGTHYDLPLAVPVALAGAAGGAILLRFLVKWGMIICQFSYNAFLRTNQMYRVRSRFIGYTLLEQPIGDKSHSGRDTSGPYENYAINTSKLLQVALLILLLVVPHLIGLVTISKAEGYTSEVFHGENSVLQVAYPGYREGVQWIAAHTYTSEQVGLVALLGTLNNGNGLDSWYDYNKSLPPRLILSEAHPSTTYNQYDYLIWPMHLIQRGFTPPQQWRDHVVHQIMGGSTIYCYILANAQAKGT